MKTLPSAGQCTEHERLTADQCEKLHPDDDNHAWGGIVDRPMPGTCGCFVGHDGKRYYNDPIDRLEEKACDQPGYAESMICKEHIGNFTKQNNHTLIFFNL